MENDALIFTDDETIRPLIRKYFKRIITGRVITFIYAGLGLLACISFAIVYVMTKKYETPEHPAFISSSFIQSGIISTFFTVLFMALGIISIKRPFVPLTIAAVFASIFFVAMIPQLLIFSSMRLLLVNGASLLFQLLSIIFLARGAYFAKKKKDLVTSIN